MRLGQNQLVVWAISNALLVLVDTRIAVGCKRVTFKSEKLGAG